MDAAIACICDRGLTDATGEAIAKRAGVTRGAMQHHFGARSDLLLAVVEDFGRALFQQSDETYPAHASIADRVTMICERYWAIVSDRHFIAVIQIWLGTRSDPALYRNLLDKMQWFEAELDRRWIRIFRDCALDPARVVVARHVALATLRGLAIRMIYRKDRTRWAAELALLQEMLTHVLAEPG